MNAHDLVTRVVLAVAMVGAAAFGTGCSQARNPAEPSRHVHEGPEAIDTSASRTTTALGSELAEVRRATARFHQVSEAFAAGYAIPDNEPCVAIPGVGAMGIHAPNPGLIGNQALDPARPELLLYLPKPNGDMQLLGVEYMQFVLVRAAPGEPADTWVSLDFNNPEPWPPTYEVVSPAPQLFGQSFGDYHAGHTPTMPWHWDLHAWIWAHNPDGVFAPFNPAVQCD